MPTLLREISDLQLLHTTGCVTDRALGFGRQELFGDPGLLLYQIANTTNMTGFNLDFKLQSLACSVRVMPGV